MRSRPRLPAFKVAMALLGVWLLLGASSLQPFVGTASADGDAGGSEQPVANPPERDPRDIAASANYSALPVDSEEPPVFTTEDPQPLRPGNVNEVEAQETVPPESSEPLPPGSVTQRWTGTGVSTLDSGSGVAFHDRVDSYLYDSPAGKYEFPKAAPHLLTLSSKNGIRSPASTFSLESAAGAFARVSNSRVVSADAASFAAAYDAVIDLQLVATVQVTYSFADGRNVPKITGEFALDENYSTISASTGFRLVWLIGLESGRARVADRDAGDVSVRSEPRGRNLRASVTGPGFGAESLGVDWTDAGQGEPALGPINAAGVSARGGLAVRFGWGATYIDPEILIQSATDSPLQLPASAQRRGFSYGGVYYAFTYENSAIKLTTSLGAATEAAAGGWSWSTKVATPFTNINTTVGWDVDQQGPDVFLAYVNPNRDTVYWAQGHIGGRSIQWEPAGSYYWGSPAFDLVSALIDSNGHRWVAASQKNATGVTSVRVFKSTSAGSVPISNLWLDPAVGPGISGFTAVGKVTPMLTSTYGGQVALVFAEKGNTKLFWKRYNSGVHNGKSSAIPNTNGISKGAAECPAEQWEAMSAVGRPDGRVAVATASPPYGPNNTCRQTLHYIDPATDDVSTTITNPTIEGINYPATRSASVSLDQSGNVHAAFSDPNGKVWYFSEASGTPAQFWESAVAFDPVLHKAQVITSAKFAFPNLQLVFFDNAALKLKFSAWPIPEEAGASQTHPVQKDGGGGFGDSINPSNGLLTVRQVDQARSIAGPDISIARVYGVPRVVDSNGNALYADDQYEATVNLLAANFGTTNYTYDGVQWKSHTKKVGFRLDVPWIGRNYLHLPGGSVYQIAWRPVATTSDPNGTADLFEPPSRTFRLWHYYNDPTPPPVFTETNGSKNQYYKLEAGDGMTYYFLVGAAGSSDARKYLWTYPWKAVDSSGNSVFYDHDYPSDCRETGQPQQYQGEFPINNPDCAGYGQLDLIKSSAACSASKCYDYYLSYREVNGSADKAGLVRYIRADMPGSSGPFNIIVARYYYDSQSRLVEVQTKTGGALSTYQLGPNVSTKYEYFDRIGGLAAPGLIKKVTHPNGLVSEYTYASSQVGTDAYTWVVTSANYKDRDSRLLKSTSYFYEFVDGWVTRTKVTEVDGATSRTSIVYNDPSARVSYTTNQDSAGAAVQRSRQWFDGRGQTEHTESITGPWSKAYSISTESWNLDASPMGFVRSVTMQNGGSGARTGITWESGAVKVAYYNGNPGIAGQADVFRRTMPMLSQDSSFNATATFKQTQDGALHTGVYPFVLVQGRAPLTGPRLGFKLLDHSSGRYVHAAYTDGSGTARTLANVTVSLNTQYRFNILYSAATRNMTLEVKTMAGGLVGSGTYTVGSNDGDGFLFDQVATIAYGDGPYQASDMVLLVDDFAFSGTVSPAPVATEARADAFGNPVYSKSADGHEVFSSYGNPSSQGVFAAPAGFNKTSSGKVLHEEFDNETLSDAASGGLWRKGGNASGSYAVDFGKLNISRTAPGSATEHFWVRAEKPLPAPVIADVVMEVPHVNPAMGSGGYVEAALVLTNTATSANDPYGGSSNAMRFAVRIDNTAKVNLSVKERKSGAETLYLTTAPDSGGARTVRWRVEFTNPPPFTAPQLRVVADSGSGMRELGSISANYSAATSYLFLVLTQKSTNLNQKVWAAFDTVAVHLRKDIAVKGLAAGQILTLSDMSGREVARTKNSTGAAFTLVPSSKLGRPNGILRVWDASGALRYTHSRADLWGGDAFVYRAQNIDLNGAWVQRESGYLHSTNVLLDEFPTGPALENSNDSAPKDGAGAMAVQSSGSGYVPLGQRGRTQFNWEVYYDGSPSPSFGPVLFASDGTLTYGGTSYYVNQESSRIKLMWTTGNNPWSMICEWTSYTLTGAGTKTYGVDWNPSNRRFEIWRSDIGTSECYVPVSNVITQGNYLMFRSATGQFQKVDYMRVTAFGSTQVGWEFTDDLEGWRSADGTARWDTLGTWENIASTDGAASGTYYHRSHPLAGQHGHRYESYSPPLLGPDNYLIQYVRLSASAPPSQLMLQFKDNGASWDGHRPYWGENRMTWELGTGMGPLAVPAGEWAEVVVRAGDIGMSGQNVNGVKYLLYNGATDWDYTVVGDANTGKLRVTVPTLGGGANDWYNITLFDSSGCPRNWVRGQSGTQYIDMYRADWNPSQPVLPFCAALGTKIDPRIRAFPFEGYITIRVVFYDAHLNIETELRKVFHGPLTKFWGRDRYEYIESPGGVPVDRFYKSTFQGNWITSRQLGSLEYQDGRWAPTPVKQESYMNYSTDGKGMLRGSKTYLGNTAYPSTVTYDIYGNTATVTDHDQHTKSFTYETVANSYPTTTTTWAKGQWPSGSGKINKYAAYDLTRGVVSQTQDHGFNCTSYQTDYLRRPTRVDSRAGSCIGTPLATTVSAYDDKVGSATTGGDTGRTRTWSDALGRVFRVDQLAQSEDDTANGMIPNQEIGTYVRTSYNGFGEVSQTAAMVDTLPQQSSWAFCKAGSAREWTAEGGTSWSVTTSDCTYRSTSGASLARSNTQMLQQGATTYEWAAKFAVNQGGGTVAYGMSIFENYSGGTWKSLFIAQRLSDIVVLQMEDATVRATYTLSGGPTGAADNASVGQSYSYRALYDTLDGKNMIYVWRNGIFMGQTSANSIPYPAPNYGTRIALRADYSQIHFSKLRIAYAESNHAVADWTFASGIDGWNGVSSSGQPWTWKRAGWELADGHIMSPYPTGCQPCTYPTWANATAYLKQQGIMTFEWRAGFPYDTPSDPPMPWGDSAFGAMFGSTGTNFPNGYMLLQWPGSVILYKLSPSGRQNVATWGIGMTLTKDRESVYRIFWDPAVKKVEAWRDGAYLGSYIDNASQPQPAYYVGLRVENTRAQFDLFRAFTGRRGGTYTNLEFRENPTGLMTSVSGTWTHDSAASKWNQTDITLTNTNSYARIEQRGVSEYEMTVNLTRFGDPAWTNQASSNPGNRYGHAFAYDRKSDRIVMFGGCAQGFIGCTNSQQTWGYDFNSNAWVLYSPVTKPTARVGHSMAYDSQSDRIILFGGFGATYLGDTWTYDFDTNTWAQVSVVGSPPSARYGHSMAYDAQSDRTVMFGGYTGSAYLADTYTFDLESKSWKLMSTGPTGRFRHTLAYDSQSDRVILYGGRDGSAVKTDTWNFDANAGATGAWANPTTTGAPATGRHSHAAAYDAIRDRMVIFGGRATVSGAVLAETWAYTLNGATSAWVQLSPPTSPAAAELLAMAYDDESDRTVLFGGINGSTYYGITYASDFTSGAGLYLFATSGTGTERGNSYLVRQHVSSAAIYRNINNASTLAASFRTAGIPANSGAAAGYSFRMKVTYDPASGEVSYWRDGLYIGKYTDTDPLRVGSILSLRTDRAVIKFGPISAMTGSVELVTKREYDTLGRVTKVINPDGTYSTTTYDDVQSTVRTTDENGHYREVVSDISGRMIESREYNDPEYWRQMAPSPKPSARYYPGSAYDEESDRTVLFSGTNSVADTWAYDADTDQWVNKNPASPPSYRYGHSMAYSKRQDKIVLFGGLGPYYFQDTWTYDLNTNVWTDKNPATKPSPRYEAGMVYDAQSDRFILFGGYNASAAAESDETWAYDLGNNTWTKMNPSGPKPSARENFAFSYHQKNDSAILFGGWDGTIKGDTWAYDLESNTWTNRNPSTPPPVMWATRMAYDVSSDRSVLWSGVTTGSSYVGETFTYDYAANAWSQKVLTTKPSQRAAVGIEYDTKSDLVVMFGGALPTGGTTDETWIFGQHDFHSSHSFYDEGGNLLRVAVATDNSGISRDIYHYTHDQWDRVVTTLYGDNGYETQTYDANDLPLVFTDRRGKQTTNSYDGFNRITRTNYSEDLSFTTYSYDYVNGLTAVSRQGASGGAALSFIYNALGRTTSETLSIAPDEVTTDYEYNRDGTLRNITYPLIPSASVRDKFTYANDDQGRPAQVTRTDTGASPSTWVAARFGYRENGGAAATTYMSLVGPSPFVLGSIYDSRNTAGLLEKRYAKSGKTTSRPILDLMYDYDAKGTITRVTSRENTTAAIAFFEETYSYDWLDRVVRATGPAWRFGTVSWTYDQFGNRLTETAGGTTKYSCYLDYGGNVIFLDSVKTGPNCTGTNLVNYQYGDFERRATMRNVNEASLGQPTGTWSFTYTAQGEIKVVDKWSTGSTADLTFYYDGSGRRVKVNDHNGGTSQDTLFVYGGLGPLVEWTKQGGSMVSWTAYAYAQSAQFMRIYDVVGAEENFWYVQDHLGSTRLTLVDDGSANTALAFKPFGADAGVSAPSEERLLFTGEQKDKEGLYATGLYYLHSRYYDPVVGRFLQPDSLLGSPESLQQMNRYAYVTNSPVMYTDPTGHIGFLVGAAIGAAVGYFGCVAKSGWSEQSWTSAKCGRAAAIYAAMGALAGSGVGIPAAIMLGAETSMILEMYEQAESGVRDPNAVLVAGLIGGATGGLAGALGPAASRAWKTFKAVREAQKAASRFADDALAARGLAADGGGAANIKEITKRLKMHVKTAKKELADDGFDKTYRKANARQYGSRLDARLKQIVRDNDPELARQLDITPSNNIVPGRGRVGGADFYLDGTRPAPGQKGGIWWDLTTEADWAAGGHQRQYEGKGIPLFY